MSPTTFGKTLVRRPQGNRKACVGHEFRAANPQTGTEFCRQKQVIWTKLATTIDRVALVAVCGYQGDGVARGLIRAAAASFCPRAVIHAQGCAENRGAA